VSRGEIVTTVYYRTTLRYKGSMKAYSVDLRANVLEAYLQQEGSIRQLAQRFKVSARFVWELVHRFRQTESYAPKPHGGGNPSCINPAQYGFISDLVKQYPEATLKDLWEYFQKKCQITPSKSSMQRVLDKLQLTRQKRHSMPQRVTQMRSRYRVKSIQRR
jgi:transposase